MSRDSLHLCHNSFSNPSVALPTSHSLFSNPSIASPSSQFILQPFVCFSFVASSSLNSPGELPMQKQHIFLEKTGGGPLTLLNLSLKPPLICIEYEVEKIPSSDHSPIPIAVFYKRIIVLEKGQDHPAKSY